MPINLDEINQIVVEEFGQKVVKEFSSGWTMLVWDAPQSPAPTPKSMYELYGVSQNGTKEPKA